MFSSLLRERGGLPLGMKLCVDDCRKKRIVGGERDSVVLVSERKGEREKRND